MSSWNDILNQINDNKKVHDNLRRDCLNELYEYTDRNVILYYSGWLQFPDISYANPAIFMINDSDKEGFMTTIHKLDRTKGLDLILHTPGGSMAATESIVHYLRQMFGTNIRAIVPDLAMSGGTMIACACKSILMGKQSSLGPIDPQIQGIPAHGIIEEFNSAKDECTKNNICIPLWQPIIAKYSPTLIGEAQKAIDWSREIVKEWLLSGMFEEQDDVEDKVNNIVEDLGNHALTKSHSRHLSAKFCESIGLNIEMMEDDQDLQDLILTLHHICTITLEQTQSVKIIENHLGIAKILQMKTVITRVPMNPQIVDK
ncbi:MAG: S49 family peptidase [Candidatus Thorarchaeota archaeon]